MDEQRAGLNFIARSGHADLPIVDAVLGPTRAASAAWWNMHTTIFAITPSKVALRRH